MKKKIDVKIFGFTWFDTNGAPYSSWLTFDQKTNKLIDKEDCLRYGSDFTLLALEQLKEKGYSVNSKVVEKTECRTKKEMYYFLNAVDFEKKDNLKQILTLNKILLLIENGEITECSDFVRKEIEKQIKEDEVNDLSFVGYMSLNQIEEELKK